MTFRSLESCVRPPWSNRLVAALTFVFACQSVFAGRNLLKDPGFEAYRLDPRGFYVLGPDTGWQEITMGKGSVQFDASSWDARPEMLRERPLGFSPGTTGFEGFGPEQNKGRMILQQDIVDPKVFTGREQLYDAWIWLGGSGRDDNNAEDTKDEAGGWEIFFYDNADTATWKDGKELEHHGVARDFSGEPMTFEQLVGYGKIPVAAKGARMRVWAATWSSVSQPKRHETEVAIDNAHFGLIDAPNMLVNGGFDLDDREGELKGWSSPALWPFGRETFKPRRIPNMLGENFDHGGYRPFYGGRWTYGYTSGLDGWRRDGFSISQFCDYPFPPGTPLVLMFWWIQDVAQGKAAQLRIVGTQIQVAVEYLRGRERLGAEGWRLDWPVPKCIANVCRYDQNAGHAYCPRLLLNPPPGTEKVGLHVNFLINAPYRDGWMSTIAAMDDFYLGPEGDVPPDRPASSAPSANP